MSAINDEILHEFLGRWDRIQGRPETTLLRLALLRDLSRWIHARKSKSLAKGEKEGSKKFGLLEPQLEKWRTVDLSKGTLKTVLESLPSETDEEREIPAKFFSSISEEKLNRYDRIWEKEICGEAIRLGWNLWVLQAWIEISHAETFHQNLNQRLWPRGVLLFVEAGTSAKNSDHHWNGNWFFFFNPQTKPENDEFLGIEGISSTPQPPEVDLRFSQEPQS